MNKSARSNLGWGPRRGTIAHVRRKVPIGYNGAPQIRPHKYPFPWTDPQIPLPASFLDPSDLWRQTASGSDPPFYTMHWTDLRTDARMHRPTYRPRESLITTGRCATKATRPNNVSAMLCETLRTHFVHEQQLLELWIQKRHQNVFVASKH